MSNFLDPRRRMLAARGRPMTLRRPLTNASHTDVTVQGFLAMFRPEQIAGDVRQGDATVAILNDEIAAASWPGPPRARDTMVIDSRAWAIQGATPVYDGSTLIGWTLWVRGG